MRMVRIAIAVIIWVVLWGDVSAANVLSGAGVALVITSVFRTWHYGELVVRPVHAARFVAFFLVKLVQASLVVARAVISPTHRVNTGIVSVPLVGCPDAVATLIADAISLTPGTLTIEVLRDPPTLFVHALDVRNVEEVRREIRSLEVLAIRAFGPATAIAGLALDDTRTWRGR